VTALVARRIVLPSGEVAELCGRLGLLCPPGFGAVPMPIRTNGLVTEGAVHPAVAAGLAATCSPRVAVLVASTVGDVAAAFGVRHDLGGSLLRAGECGVEMSVWPALRLGDELARAVPILGASPLPALDLPLPQVAERPDLRAAIIGRLRATVVAPPSVVGQVIWLATRTGWLSLEPAAVRDGVRWAVVRPVAPADLGAAVAPLVASAVS
jgi:hypothetical protein